MRVTISVVARQQPFERVDQVVVTSRARFDDGDPRGGVGDENVAQAVAVRRAERPHIVGEIDDAPSRGVDIEHVGIHASRVRTRLICSPLPGSVDRRNLINGSVAPPGRCPEEEGVDRVRTFYHCSGATLVNRRWTCAYSR
jgi:hypothetical protein